MPAEDPTPAPMPVQAACRSCWLAAPGLLWMTLFFLVPLALASAAAALLGWRLTGVLAPMKATDAVPPTAFDGA